MRRQRLLPLPQVQASFWYRYPSLRKTNSGEEWHGRSLGIPLHDGNKVLVHIIVSCFSIYTYLVHSEAMESPISRWHHHQVIRSQGLGQFEFHPSLVISAHPGNCSLLPVLVRANFEIGDACWCLAMDWPILDFHPTVILVGEWFIQIGIESEPDLSHGSFAWKIDPDLDPIKWKSVQFFLVGSFFVSFVENGWRVASFSHRSRNPQVRCNSRPVEAIIDGSGWIR